MNRETVYFLLCLAGIFGVTAWANLQSPDLNSARLEPVRGKGLQALKDHMFAGKDDLSGQCLAAVTICRDFQQIDERRKVIWDSVRNPEKPGILKFSPEQLTMLDQIKSEKRALVEKAKKNDQQSCTQPSGNFEILESGIDLGDTKFALMSRSINIATDVCYFWKTWPRS